MLREWSTVNLWHELWDWDHFPESASGACAAGGARIRREALDSHQAFIERVKAELVRRGCEAIEEFDRITPHRLSAEEQARAALCLPSNNKLSNLAAKTKDHE